MTSLEKWLGKKTTSELPQKKPIILGILGYSSKWTRDSLVDQVINPLLGEVGNLPYRILMPSEGDTNILFQIWAERQGIDHQILDADWKRLGRKARALRDGNIIKESTHLFIFMGSRSDYYEKVAIRETKKGKGVFTFHTDSMELVSWVNDA